MKTRVSFKDILLAVHDADPIAAIKRLSPSLWSLKIAYRNGSDAAKSVIKRFVTTVHGVDLTRTERGRSAPKEGERRSYVVQSLPGNSGFYVRLPVNILGAKKGDIVTVTSSKSRIVVDTTPL